jgi:hypothetical protein
LGFIVDSRERNSKEAGLKFIDIVSTQTSTTSESKLRAFVPPCETLLLLALRSMTRHKDQHDAISHTETRRLIHRTEQNLRLLEALGSSASKGIITSTLAMGFDCVMELNQWFYALTPQ